MTPDSANMVKFIVKRIFISFVIVFIVSVFAFLLMHILPGDPVRIVLGDEASVEDVNALREELHLNDPLLSQYLKWISGIFTGDYGTSITYMRPAGEIISERLPKTVSIGLPALIIASIVGIIFGTVSAVKRGSKLDSALTLLSTLSLGTPTFWIGILLIYIFAVELRILPMKGYMGPSDGILEYLRYSILPIFCLSLNMVAGITRQTRTNMLDVINQDYIRTARANGISEKKVIFKHALKNALIPVITQIALQVRVVIGGSVIVEQIFNINGIGMLLRESIFNRDYMIVQTSVFFISLVTVFCNLVVDICYGFVNPQIRKSGW